MRVVIAVRVEMTTSERVRATSERECPYTAIMTCLMNTCDETFAGWLNILLSRFVNTPLL